MLAEYLITIRLGTVTRVIVALLRFVFVDVALLSVSVSVDSLVSVSSLDNSLVSLVLDAKLASLSVKLPERAINTLDASLTIVYLT